MRITFQQLSRGSEEHLSFPGSALNRLIEEPGQARDLSKNNTYHVLFALGLEIVCVLYVNSQPNKLFLYSSPLISPQMSLSGTINASETHTHISSIPVIFKSWLEHLNICGQLCVTFLNITLLGMHSVVMMNDKLLLLVVCTSTCKPDQFASQISITETVARCDK